MKFHPISSHSFFVDTFLTMLIAEVTTFNRDILFQRRSPYLEDANTLIDLANQMGLIANEIQKKVPNATHCLTWSAVQASHTRKGQDVIFKLQDIYGLMILLAMGLGGATIILIAEYAVHKTLHRKDVA